MRGGIVADITDFVDAVAWLDALLAATFQRFPVVGVTTRQFGIRCCDEPPSKITSLAGSTETEPKKACSPGGKPGARATAAGLPERQRRMVRHKVAELRRTGRSVS
jgi:hypothetical protein